MTSALRKVWRLSSERKPVLHPGMEAEPEKTLEQGAHAGIPSGSAIQGLFPQLPKAGG